ncbi:similar to Saccharomyces cerevisiae YNL119W NCS2 Protein required for thiolation of the uridine at the wobble position of Lys(UUU) and Glu(UUC) tRNAs [Maudiozyma barnettii]|uniref:Cytoplasmic tRNA 2-thiolation protein 2 n=1 Tax=Maudiozyma barnettii TaxID=61262 RepID=A0A8H2VBM5_9SACH|nr:Ncs2p [Kazachstania barnettii]CAB4252317.1 similar to Saccharomyces cerevisiae YNL119W NCS2 Protein required for thiolation of the uridine at the wobble position of Lys(UUU) and Glu(UUC) tRNAs [Kazachstania barnettii]CAD1779051.1 similar to Saccharomyces cerevisiae YNL119W NCS2 Protein required for thiolation of the uridine at the wobble position of Lys(UUU) and Glu(UUC) tRNAs [Kazachstania barnettii]
MTAIKCKRCKENDATVKSRKEPFCDACFLKFVSLKQRKLMMTDEFYRDHFKVLYGKDLKNNGVSKIVVPFDFSSSSFSALDVLVSLLKEQNLQHRGRVGFRVKIITVFKNEQERELFEQSWKMFRNSDIYDDQVWLQFEWHLINAESFFRDAKDLQQIILHHQDFNSMGLQYELKDNSEYNIEVLLARCPNRNTRNDMWIFIVSHLIKKFAYQQTDCEVILWAHSMTKLADHIIGLVVKGRGAQIAASLNSTVFDSDYGARFKNLYPLKNTLLSELDAYCIITGLNKYIVNYTVKNDLMITKDIKEKSADLSQNVRLVKNMTINELARKYFNDIEGEYSNIIATVLRTGDKLKPPTIINKPEGYSNEISKCSICLNTIYSNPSEWLRNIAINRGHPIETKEEQELYKQWQSSQVGIQTEVYLTLRNKAWSEGHDIPLCYGCIINLNGIKTREIIWPKHEEDELENVLNEFELSD